MSAYIVERDHIRYLVEAALKLRLGHHPGHGPFSWYWNGDRRTLPAGDYERACEVARMLWAENIASVAHRYPNEPQNDLPGPAGESFEYTEHRPWDCNIDPVQVLKACSCFEYQSCEHEGWKTSEALAFVDALVWEAISALPGYADAAWGAPRKPVGVLRT